MDLKTFIAETLVQIQEGVEEAIKRRPGDPRHVGAVNPHFSTHQEDLEKIVEKVSFDVAVTVSKSGEGEARGGLQVLGLDVGGKANISKEDSTISRIQFVVPFVPPSTAIDGDATRESNERHNAAMSSRRFTSIA